MPYVTVGKENSGDIELYSTKSMCTCFSQEARLSGSLPRTRSFCSIFGAIALLKLESFCRSAKSDSKTATTLS